MVFTLFHWPSWANTCQLHCHSASLRINGNNTSTHASVLLHSQSNWSKWLLCSLPDLTFIHSECSGDCARSDAIVLLYFSNVKACQEQGEAVNKLFVRVWGPYSLWSRNNQSQEVRLDFLQRVQFLTCCQLTLYSKERSSAETHPERALGSRELPWLERCQFKSTAQLRNSLNIYPTQAFERKTFILQKPQRSSSGGLQ